MKKIISLYLLLSCFVFSYATVQTDSIQYEGTSTLTLSTVSVGKTVASSARIPNITNIESTFGVDNALGLVKLYIPNLSSSTPKGDVTVTFVATTQVLSSSGTLNTETENVTLKLSVAAGKTIDKVYWKKDNAYSISISSIQI